ncbi:hypothetical protein RND81_11G102200 [Saponaria officinalis]|uniref:Uncharacterized protein n=1 Tax=Saponaria officinalis TaxID=3572 RepID=A0AAW1HJB1_SAPOF
MATTYSNDNNAEKAKIEAIMSTEVAKRLIAEAKRDEPSVVGEIENNRGALQLLASTHWIGKFFEAPPGSVGAGEMIMFSHNGSKGAFIYGEPEGSSNAAAYLLAWNFSSGTFMVYVRCGPVSEVFHDGWESETLTRLNSAATESYATHAGTSSSAQARITNATGGDSYDSRASTR